jgi:hypothetical protein
MEKLRLLDQLRERALAIRSATTVGRSTVQEKPAHYGSLKGKKQ